MRLPSILKDLLPSDSVKQLMDLVNQPHLVSGLKDAAQQLGWKEAWGTTQLQHAMMQTKKWMETFNSRWASENHETLRLGVNATGQFFSSRWSNVPLSSQAISTFAVISGGYSEPTAIAQDLNRILMGLTGAHACLVTHNVEQALSLLRLGLPANKRWAIPRADAIRLSSGSDIAALLSIHESSVIEAGASNACSAEDYGMAIEAGAGAVLCVEPSRLPRASHSTENLAIHAAREHRVPVVELLLNGSLVDLSSIGIEAPIVSERLKSGMDAVVFPGDGWIGGPPCGIIVGREAFIKPLVDLSIRLGMMAHPLLLGTLHAALVAGKELDSWKQTPLGLMASNGVENLHQRAKRLAIQLEGLPTVNQVMAEVSRFAVASSPMELTSVDSGALRIEPKGMTVKELQAKLAARETPIWCLSDERSIVIVLRTVEPSDDQEIVAAFGEPDS
jgi:L-seryl-tRNA(Ser) seleniumtransferase